LNVRHFGMVEGTELKSMASMSRSMAWPLYWISWKSTNWFKSYSGGGHTDGQTDRQTCDLISLTFLFKESRLTTATSLNTQLNILKQWARGRANYDSPNGQSSRDKNYLSSVRILYIH
jgi:hypothetical protein